MKRNKIRMQVYYLLVIAQVAKVFGIKGADTLRSPTQNGLLIAMPWNNVVPLCLQLFCF